MPPSTISSFPTDKTPPDEIAATIEKSISKAVVKPASRSRTAVDDFNIAARVEIALVTEGHNVGVKTAQVPSP